ncbi:hypothetical protein [Pseudoalteromonas phage KB12-38]|nr:hypothetical protein [Pseudoalteromonas phage KB12-38]
MRLIDYILNIVATVLGLVAAIFVVVASCEVFGFDTKETSVMVVALLLGYLVFWD